jgi:hypothetical protein
MTPKEVHLLRVHSNKRILITFVVLMTTRILFPNSLLSFFLLMMLDELDNPLNSPRNDPTVIDGRNITQSHIYQTRDKVNDLFAYTLFLLLYSHLLPPMFLAFIVGGLIFRAIGVYLYNVTLDARWLIVFPDIINSSMIIYIIYLIYPMPFFSAAIALGIVIKVIVECKVHTRDYIQLDRIN